PFPRESLPEGFRMAIDDDAATEEDTAHNTCRSADEPYREATTYTVTLDGFIVSENVKVSSYRHMDAGYQYSDHDPVIMEFTLQ
ncbi:MAG: endonuclease/exonuclease/phosphatase family protein, partial [Lachnospiraceae bacterium]|nr:endonuclease/exonuclease/phosphatase family protein [Lachnospiraceae bacterium]